ncbi:hypothetical protein GCM10010266_46760 [Streptomyces griseomycini]|nr:hypothetical protein GCM10010266_46760 [Streptomyces griseomycini]
MAERGVEQHLGAQHIGAGEGAAVGDGTVDVRLGGEVHDLVVASGQRVHQGRVAHVALDEGEVGVVAHRVEVCEAAGVGEFVEDGHRRAPGSSGRQEVAYVGGADEARPAGDEDRCVHGVRYTLLWSPITRR